ncbi:MAG: hypothetical protein EXS67_05580 [Candidatus Margulisbacteria bacterium]|nr:hypothetical protein [Candidatus Margulisiibacteriota bacterium]
MSVKTLELFFDKTLTTSYKTLEIYFKTENIQYDKKELLFVRKNIEEQVFEAVHYISHLIYHIQKNTGDWGAAGEQQTKNAFLKTILQLPADQNINYEHYSEFEEKINQTLLTLGIHNIPTEIAKSQLKDYKFKFLGKLFKSSEADEINKLLAFSGSHKYYFCSVAGTNLYYYLYGTAKISHVKEYTIATYQTEDCCSPNVISALAALTGKQVIIIRNYSLETIFQQKWIPAIESKNNAYFQSNSYWTISQAIKEKCLHLYGAHDSSELLNQKTNFLKDMKETIAHHELGHTVINHRYLSPEELGLGQATEKVKETIYASMLEFFADFAPKCEGFLGPMQNMCRIALKDPLRAERMFYMYLSDIWFYDTPDEYMYIYSDLMILVLIKYIQPDQHINFTALENDTHIRKERPNKENLTILERLYELYILETKEIKLIAETANYQLATNLSYTQCEKLINEILKEKNPLIPKNSDTYGLLYWTSVINFILNLSDSKERFINYLEDQEKSILRKILILACGRKKAEAYNYDHRKFICDRMIELGFTSK